MYKLGDYMEDQFTLTGLNAQEFLDYRELLDELDIAEGDQADYSQVKHLSKALEGYLDKLSKEDLA